MKLRYTGKTLFVPCYCVDEVEALIAKRRRQALISKLGYVSRDKEAAARIKEVIDATSDKPISIEDCEALIGLAAVTVPKKGREVLPDKRVVYSTDYIAIYRWHMGGEKDAPKPKPIDKIRGWL